MTDVERIESDFVIKQRAICEKYTAGFLDAPFGKIIGVAIKTFEKFDRPINGLRHPIENERSASWYIWAGEELSQDVDFFKPMHIYHLLELCPKAINYLGLAPGWRFLFDNMYEDVWYDAKLLNI